MNQVAQNRESIDNFAMDKKECLKEDKTNDSQKIATDKVGNYLQFLLLHYMLIMFITKILIILDDYNDFKPSKKKTERNST